jgi:hypothetical protein
MTPRLQSMASYIAALLRIRNELSTSAGPELRAVEAALAAFTKELQAAQRKRQAAYVVSSLCSSRFLLRQRTSDCGGVKGLGAGAGAGRGGDAGFCVPSLAIVPAICCWLPASRSTLCRKLASAAGISLSCCNSCFSCAKSSLSCCSSGEAVACGAAAVCSGAACGTDAVSGANEASCGHEVAIIALAASPYHCQSKVAQTPIENTIRKRTRPREALLPSDGRIPSRAEPAIASSPGRATSGWCAASRKRPPALASSLSTSAAFRPMRSRKCALKSSGNLGGVGVTVEFIGTPPLSSSWFAVSHHPVARPRPRRGGRAAKQAYYGGQQCRLTWLM